MISQVSGLRFQVSALRLLAVLCILSSVLCAGGCAGTVVPSAVHSTAASFDGNEQNSGIVAALPGGYVVTAHFRDRYNALIATWGKAYSPRLEKDAGLVQMAATSDGPRWIIDRQHMVRMLEMNTWRKSGRPPP